MRFALAFALTVAVVGLFAIWEAQYMAAQIEALYADVIRQIEEATR